MFERLTTPQEAYDYKLGATLKMENKVLEILDESIENAANARTKELFAAHRRESEQHVRTIEEVFDLCGWDAKDSPCPAIEGLQKEGKANAKKTNEALVDAVLLQGALEVEHYEIGVYENLIVNAEAMGRDDVVELLRRNLRSEQAALEKVRALEAALAAESLRQPA